MSERLSDGPSSANVRVVVVDDHAIVRAGLEALLVSPYRVVASVSNAPEALEATAQHQPDIVLLDIRLGDSSGIEAIGPIRAAAQETRVVMLSTFEELAWARAAVEAGACGYLVKDADQLDLIRGLDRVMRGTSPWTHGSYSGRTSMA